MGSDGVPGGDGIRPLDLRADRTRRAGVAAALLILPASAAAADGDAQSQSMAIELVRILPALAWPLVLAGVLYWKRKFVGRLSSVLARRIESGAAIKLSGVIEVGEGARGTVGHIADGTFSHDETRRLERSRILTENRGLMVAHTLHPSSVDGQVYDVLLYLVTSWGSFLEVKEVR